ncbi:MAG: choice-of-anchor L domain-containing protein, partial [Bacteroidota bacterium]
MKNHCLTFAALLILISITIDAQLTVTSGYTAQDLGEILAGNNIAVTNSSVTGASLQSGAFQFQGTGLNVNSGVILSTGNVFDAIGPNSSGSTSSGMGGAGNPLLTALAGYNTNDAVVLQFDFEVQSDMIEFKYIFLSEEYNEWVGSGYNDVFAFFISGPGISGEENLAVVPGTTTPVSINTINSGSFWQFYVNNETGTTNIEFDGFTTLMTAKKEGLIPCETYTLKLMIADGSDAAYDSGVLLQENSLVQANVSATTNTFSANDIALEGCIQASFTFQLDSAMVDDVNISIGIGGTAINGVDYAHIDSLIVIPAGQTSATIVIDSYGDGLTEGQETVELYFYPAPCQPADTVILYIDDYTLIEYTTTPSDLTCNGDTSGEVTLTVSGGIPPYYITLTDSATNQTTTYTTNPVIGLTASTYYVQVMDGYGCSAQDIIYGDIFDGGPVFLPDGTGLSYTTSINISGFGAGQTLSNVNQIQSICMNMEHSRIGELEVLLEAPGGTQIVLKQQPGGAVTNMGEPCAIGPADAGNTDTSPGIGYNYCFTPNPTYGTMVSMANLNSYTYTTICYGTIESDKYLPPGSYESYQSLGDLVGVPLNGDWTLIITDEIPNNNGWIFSWSISLSADQPDSVFTIDEPILPVITTSSTQPDCGLNNGAINISITGGFSPFTYLWNTAATTEDISNLTSGTYSVTITGTDNCEYEYSFNLSNNGTLALSGTTNDVTCPGANNGIIDLTVSGGTGPFTFLWSNLSATEDISNLSSGNYYVTVNDGGGCMGIETFTVNQVPPIYVSANITNENCGDNEGIINLSVSGGTSPYSFLWSNSDITEDINELAQGNFYVTITDFNSCSFIDTFTVLNYVGNCIPNCDLEISSSVFANETCGNGNGLIDLTIFTSFSPYSVQWSNGATTDDITALSANTYTITITDGEGCEEIQNFDILNLTGNLAITSIVPTNEICGNGAGSIDISVSGGALPYYYIWSNSSTNQDLVNIHQGEYFVTITDANNCAVYTSGIVYNNSGTLALTYGNAVNEVCGNHQGSIDIIISGGSLPYSYHWSNGSTSQDLIGISAGNYTCTITDNSSCSITTPTYIVSNESGTLSLSDVDIDNEICGNSLGSIEILLGGGT